MELSCLEQSIMRIAIYQLRGEGKMEDMVATKYSFIKTGISLANEC